MIVTLTKEEQKRATIVGVARHVQARDMGLKDKHGLNVRDAIGVHIDGACGELAAAKALKRDWGATVGTFKRGADLGEKIQVRTRSKDFYELIVRSDDPDDHFFVLVTGTAPVFNVVGWIRGSVAKKEAWKKTHGGRPAAYFVPQSELKKI